MSYFIRDWTVRQPSGRPKGCIIALAGRSHTPRHLFDFCEAMQLDDTLVVSVACQHNAWYPQPYSPQDQSDAVKGLEPARRRILRLIRQVKSAWHLKAQEIALMGFSAGAVMSLYTATRSSEKLLAVVALAGAILEPHNVPSCKIETSIILQHNRDDDCFKWEERYLPMKTALEEAGYNLTCLEADRGGHQIRTPEVIAVAQTLAPLFGYEESWQHPGFDEFIERKEEEKKKLSY